MKILLIEDNPVDAIVIQDELQQVEDHPRFEVTVIHRLGDIKSAIDNESFDMVLLDLGLDDSQGLDTLRTARRLLPHLAIVVLSGLEDEALALQAVRESAQDYVVKDRWNRRLLVRSILHAFERHQLMVAKDRAERAQREIEVRFRAIFEGTHDLICIKDCSFRITHVNPAMELFFGRKASEIVGSTEEHLYGGECSAQIRKWDMRVLDGETLEEEHTRSVDGELVTFLDVRMPLRDERKGIVGVCVASRNITERKRAVPQDHVALSDYPSKAMHSLLLEAAKIAKTESIVLLQGATGSGKDYLARWIHEHSHRRSGPYFVLNCAALGAELVESELFGHEAGAFTGARGRKKGILELAEGGSLLLNEIGELPLSLQSKLLTFLDTRAFLRVGGQKSVTVDARLMAASHRDLMAEVGDGRFLQPLYYRLAVFTLEVPPLRERKEDIPLLVDEIMADLARGMNLSHMPVIDSSTIDELRAHDWPGNVRELRNVVERALILSGGTRLDVSVPDNRPCREISTGDLPFPSQGNLHKVMDEVTKLMCAKVLRSTGGNKKQAAETLGISRDALYRYIRRFGIRA